MIDDAASAIRVFGDVMGRTVAVSATPGGTLAASPEIIGDNPRMATRSSSSKNGADYSEASIRVLKGLEPVRQRPGMYTRTENPLHIIQEVIDNAADEALGGYARHIDVRLFKDGRVEVTDDGRGIPVGLHPDEGVPVIEIVFTRLHAGGKFDKTAGGAYSFSGGLHGVGVSVTNALSRRLEVTVWRKGDKDAAGTRLAHTIAFADGELAESLVARPATRRDPRPPVCPRSW